MGSLDDKSEEGNNSILEKVAFWSRMQQNLYLENEYCLDRVTSVSYLNKFDI